MPSSSAGKELPTKNRPAKERPAKERRKKPEKPAPDIKDAHYGPHPRQVFDLWLPRYDRPAPLVVHIHGGGFRLGDKRSISYEILVHSLEAGFAVAAINYRLSDEVTFPAFMHDCGRAIQFLRHHAPQWGIDPTRVAATGGSAGGGISLWLGFHPDLADPKSSDPVARESTRLQCLGLYNTQCSYDPNFYRSVGLGPAAEHPFMPPFYGLMYEEMDTPRARRLFEEASPMTWLHAGGPPVFLFYGQADEPLPEGAEAQRTWRPGLVELPPADPLANLAIHHPKMGRIIQERLSALGVECILRVNLAEDELPQVRKEVVEFFKRCLLG